MACEFENAQREEALKDVVATLETLVEEAKAGLNSRETRNFILTQGIAALEKLDRAQDALAAAAEKEAPEPKTYGEHATRIAADMKTHGKMGFFILEQAISILAEHKGIVMFDGVEGVLMHHTPGYKRLGVCLEDPSEEARLMAEVRR